MIERELYIKVLDCLHDEQCLAKKVQMIQERDFQVIGNVIINMLLEEIAEAAILFWISPFLKAIRIYPMV